MEPSPEDESFVRPFMITGGRTVGDAGEIPIEAMVVATTPDTAGLGPDPASVVSLCHSPLSVAEIGAHLGVPVGVARVLVADLTASGHVDRYQTAASDDATIVRRLLHGIRSL
ncbi:MAG: DUF742 domain-containing protein [Actinomycetota bacterium]